MNERDAARRVSLDDSCLPDDDLRRMSFLVPPSLRRWHSADYIDKMGGGWSPGSEETLGRKIYSEADAETVRRRQAAQRAQQFEIAREIYTSRSLFDPRNVPELCFSRPSLYLRFSRCLVLAQHYFVFLQLGIVTALLWANIDWESYSAACLSHEKHSLNFHFFINDVFMALFFGIAVVHVTTAMLPGGSLFPLNKALSPLLGTLGGVIGPALIYLGLVALEGNFQTQSQGWAICIATDISIAWLLATQVFGTGSHPAVEFLLLLAVVDDIIGLVVIAIAFPTGEMHLLWLLLLLGAVGICSLLRWGLKLEHWGLFILTAGPVAWYSLYKSGIHPSLALCFVVPFIPRSNLDKFDHQCSLVVHIGLFFFALSNAGVAFTGVGLLTLNIAVSLVLGKTLGIFAFTFAGIKLYGLALPEGMSLGHLGLLAHVSGVGLTVALFVAELAFEDRKLQDHAKLGALLSVLVAPSAILIGKLTGASKKFIPQKPLVEELLPQV